MEDIIAQTLNDLISIGHEAEDVESAAEFKRLFAALEDAVDIAILIENLDRG